MTQLLLGITGGRDLTHIGSVVTERSVIRLFDERGRKLAEVDDDTEHANSSADTTAVFEAGSCSPQ